MRSARRSDRPLVTLPLARPAGLVKIQRVSLEEYQSGIGMKSFKVTASVKVNEKGAGENLAALFSAWRGRHMGVATAKTLARGRNCLL